MFTATGIASPLDFSPAAPQFPAPPLGGLALQRVQTGHCSACAAPEMLTVQWKMQSMLLDVMGLLLGLMGNAAPVAPVTTAAPPAGNATSVKAGGPRVQRLIDAALSKQGTPYVFGAAGPDKFDCSGLVSWALKQAGSDVPRLTAEGLRKHYAGASVSRNELQPGDLVFFWSPNDRGIPRGQATHVEIYLGNGQTMGTDSAKEGARVEPINWDTFIGGARPPELAG